MASHPAGSSRAAVLRCLVLSLLTALALLAVSPAAAAQELVGYDYDYPARHLYSVVVPAVPQICGPTHDGVGASHGYDDAAQPARTSASRVGGFLAPQTGADDCGEPGDFRHYTTEEGHAGIEMTGVIRIGESGKIFVTPTVYSSGAEAQSKLALPFTPSGYFEIPRDRLANLYGPNWPVDPNYGQPGGGIEYWTTLPIVAPGLQWVPIGP